MVKKQVAKLNYLRMSPRKVRAVADLVKGISVNEAEAQLLHERRRPSKPLLKLLRSAVANAKNSKQLSSDNLLVESFRVDQAPMMKRYLPRARGMATPIQKKASHVTLVLTESEKVKQPRFTVVVPKKTKRTDGERVRGPKERGEKDFTSSSKAKKPGFFRKVFSRKSGGE